MFEPETDFNENQPFNKDVSQYPFEDILEKFYCYFGDSF
jgi:hypothetical protein